MSPACKAARSSQQQGASLIEACLALAIICLVFLGMFQVSRVLAARDTLNHAAARAARARTVGFNQWMVHKVARVAAIPNAGRMLEPVYDSSGPDLRAAITGERAGTVWDRVLRGDLWPSFAQARLEIARVPEYLAAANHARADYILNYEDWDSVHVVDGGSAIDVLLDIRVAQEYPLKIPVSGSFYADGEVRLVGESAIENHYPLYLEDMGW